MKISNEGKKVTKYFESLKLRDTLIQLLGVNHGL
ncbi:hypothetical protein CPT_Muenster_225 [Klebsiella phage Muenster]|nr:hypothetical protein CPT_Muenster_225 [Klebsiella phage Muenster]